MSFTWLILEVHIHQGTNIRGGRDEGVGPERVFKSGTSPNPHFLNVQRPLHPPIPSDDPAKPRPRRQPCRSATAGGGGGSKKNRTGQEQTLR